MQCGDKKSIEDVLEHKVERKKFRLALLEKGIDPSSVYPSSQDRKKKEEEYLKPFVFDR